MSLTSGNRVPTNWKGGEIEKRLERIQRKIHGVILTIIHLYKSEIITYDPGRESYVWIPW